MLRQMVRQWQSIPYTVVLKLWEDEHDRYYVTQVPELWGCMGTGETPREALRDLRDAKESIFEVMYEDGEKPPTPKYDTQITEIGRYTKAEMLECICAVNEMQELIEGLEDVDDE